MIAAMDPGNAAGALRGLKRFVSGTPAAQPGERCELCRAEIGNAHAHVVNLESRALLCTCRACYLLFTRTGAAHRKYRAVPERYCSLPSFHLTPAQWERLQIPVGIAFFFFNYNFQVL